MAEERDNKTSELTEEQQKNDESTLDNDDEFATRDTHDATNLTKSAKFRHDNDKNIKAAVAYGFLWIGGFVLLLLEREDKYVRFHAAQSLLTFGVLQLLIMVPTLGLIFFPFVSLLTFVLWAYLLVVTYQGKNVKLPIVAEYAVNLEQRLSNNVDSKNDNSDNNGGDK